MLQTIKMIVDEGEGVIVLDSQVWEERRRAEAGEGAVPRGRTGI